MSTTSGNGRHPTTIRRKAPVTNTLLTRRARALERHLAGAAEGSDTGVHQARVASRRLREALPVLAVGVKGASKARRRVRRVTRALGTAREMDVAVLLLDELARRPGVPRDALEDVRAHVLVERERRRAAMLARLQRLNSAKLSRKLAAVSLASGAPADSRWRDVLAARIRTRAQRLAAAVASAGQMYAPERLHAVRIAAKKLRYTLELAAESRAASTGTHVRVLKRLQDVLGRLNDLHVMQQHVARVQAHPPGGRTRTDDAGLDAMQGMLEEECRHLHARYSKLRPALLSLAEECRSGALARSIEGGGRRPLLKAVASPATRAPVARRA